MENIYIIAHRGITENGLEENTLQSLTFMKKIKTEFKLGVEFDIQITLDNKIILYHDEFVDSLCVENTNFSDIKVVKIT